MVIIYCIYFGFTVPLFMPFFIQFNYLHLYISCKALGIALVWKDAIQTYRTCDMIKKKRTNADGLSTSMDAAFTHKIYNLFFNILNCRRQHSATDRLKKKDEQDFVTSHFVGGCFLCHFRQKYNKWVKC